MFVFACVRVCANMLECVRVGGRYSVCVLITECQKKQKNTDEEIYSEKEGNVQRKIGTKKRENS